MVAKHRLLWQQGKELWVAKALGQIKCKPPALDPAPGGSRDPRSTSVKLVLLGIILFLKCEDFVISPQLS